MITVESPILSMRELSLEPEIRVTKGGQTVPVEKLKGWTSLGQPIAVPINEKYAKDDKELLLFLEREAKNFRYHLAHLACTFNPGEGEPFVNAWLEVKLMDEDHVLETQPIAWSMKPRRMEDPIEISRTVNIGGSLKLLEEIAGVEGEYQRNEKRTRKELFIVALNELQSNPTWQFSRIETIEIRGSYNLALIVRTHKASVTQGTVNLYATIQRKRLGLIPYRVPFPDADPLSFTLVKS